MKLDSAAKVKGIKSYKYIPFWEQTNIRKSLASRCKMESRKANMSGWKRFPGEVFLSPRNMQNFALLWGIFTYKHINLRLEKLGSPTWTVEYAIHVVVNSQHIISELRCGGNSPTDVAEKHTDYQIRQCCTNKSLYAKKAQPHLFLPSLSP